MSFFGVVYEFIDEGEKLLFSSSIIEPCETVEDDSINALLDILIKIFKLCKE
jgi:AAA15 family ATPase/GTPase